MLKPICQVWRAALHPSQSGAYRFTSFVRPRINPIELLQLSHSRDCSFKSDICLSTIFKTLSITGRATEKHLPQFLFWRSLWSRRRESWGRASPCVLVHARVAPLYLHVPGLQDGSEGPYPRQGEPVYSLALMFCFS